MPRERPDDPHALLEHDGFLRALARSLVIDEARADDVVQQAWLAAIRRGPERPGSLRAWLATAVRHIAARLRRGESRRERHELAAARGESTPSVAEIVAREQARRRVVEAVLELEEPARTTMLLRYFERLPPRAIARDMGVPVETVRTRIKRALERLRARLDADFGGERAAWAVALLPFAKAAPTSALAGAVGGAAAFVASISGGVLLMSAKAKLLLAGAAVAVGIAVTLFVTSDRIGPAHRRAEGLAAADRRAAPAIADGAAPEAATREAEPVRAPPAAAPGGAAAVAPATGALAVRVVWGADHAKAAGIGVTLITQSGANPQAGALEATSDDEGRCSFTGVAAGDCLLLGDRGGSLPTQIEPGATRDVELTIPRGVVLAGVVVDARGEGVRDAEVWLSGERSSLGRVVARSDSEGRFTIRSVTPPQAIGARAAGFAPSALQSFHFGAHGLTQLRLVLHARGGAVGGRVVRVVDGKRVPVVNALVQLGDERRLTQVSTRGDMTPMALVLRHRSDGDGRFRFAGTMTGDVPLLVVASGLAPSRGRVAVKPEASADVEVELLAGATLAGRVVRADESAVAGAEVRVGAIDSLGGARLRSGGDGRFRFDHLAPGPLEVSAAGDADGFASASLVATDGATLEWDARLAAGPSIRGRVLDQEEHPIPGCEVRGLSFGAAPSDLTIRSAKSGEDGRFEMANCDRHPYQLEVRPPAMGFTSSQFAQDVVPGGDEIVFHISHATPATAWILGQVTDSDGQPIGDASIFPFPKVSAAIVGNTFTTGEDGRFKAGPLAPGAYSLSVRKEGSPDLFTPDFELTADERHDLGTLRMPRGGMLHATFARADGRELEPLEAIAYDLKNGARSECLLDGDIATLPLAPGRYELRTRGGGCAPSRAKFEIAEGKQCELEIELKPASEVVLLLTGLDAVIAPLHSNTPYAFASVVDASGAVLDDRGLPAFPDHTVEWRIALAPGEYRVEIRGGRDRMLGRASFTVPADHLPEEFDLEVR